MDPLCDLKDTLEYTSKWAIPYNSFNNLPHSSRARHNESVWPNIYYTHLHTAIMLHVLEFKNIL